MSDISYRIDTTPISNVAGEDLTFDGTLDDLREIDLNGRKFTVEAPPAFTVTVSNVGTGFVATGMINATLNGECERCLEPTIFTVAGSVEGLYVTEHQAEALGDEEDSEPVDEHGNIDLFPAMLAGIVFEIPFVLHCKESCAGLCTRCGSNLNEGPCDCPDTEEPSGPFAALADLNL